MLKAMTLVAGDHGDAGTGDDSSGRIECLVKLKISPLDSIFEVHGLSNNHILQHKSWWWNKQVNEAVQEEHACLKVYHALKRVGKTARLTPRAWQNV